MLSSTRLRLGRFGNSNWGGILNIPGRPGWLDNTRPEDNTCGSGGSGSGRNDQSGPWDLNNIEGINDILNDTDPDPSVDPVAPDCKVAAARFINRFNIPIAVDELVDNILGGRIPCRNQINFNVEVLDILLSPLGLTEEEENCLRASQSTTSEVLDLMYNSEISNPCDPNRDSENIIEDAVSRVCGNGGVGGITVNELYMELNNEDWIEESSSFLNCPYARCIYNKILDTRTPSTCDLVELLFDSENFGVRLK